MRNPGIFGLSSGLFLLSLPLPKKLREIMQQAGSAILAQNLLRLAHNNKISRLVLAAILPFVGVLAAFGIAPGTVTEKPVVSKVIEEVALPHLPAGGNRDEAYWQEERLQ